MAAAAAGAMDRSARRGRVVMWDCSSSLGCGSPGRGCSAQRHLLLQASTPGVVFTSARPAAISSVEYLARSFFQMQVQVGAAAESPFVHAPWNSVWATASGNLPLHVSTSDFLASSKRSPWKSPRKSARLRVLRSEVHAHWQYGLLRESPPVHPVRKPALTVSSGSLEAQLVTVRSLSLAKRASSPGFSCDRSTSLKISRN